MIELGKIDFDSYDSGPGRLELLGQGDQLFVRVYKHGPDVMPSYRPDELRDDEYFREITLNSRNLAIISLLTARERRAL